ncbi:hypothetical protein PS627_02809 [Pseudomonas fluorescens]|uniref:MerR family transcriptional regulator n=1 Tax=Pseudomonas fluorescens TaxID=294 RepID=UPI0012571B76|nr:MerR family transcriptional regulator [Pseudomonas fluorescens]CAG8868048.1 hypothetical protein PS627_02809 [Pseudomonas fluorescens]VVP96851.1 hypothetical protein PS910_03421 [Pseudomonas fluorescens]
MPSEALLPIREVARLTGVNPVTLRAWERRYGLLTPGRTGKGHRLYPADQVERVQAILRWLERGASVGQVRALLDSERQVPVPSPQGDWPVRCEQLIEAIGNLAQRPLDQLLNQAMALYPAVTLCERLLLPVLDILAHRWQSPFNPQLEQVFFNSWLRSKLGARVYHDNHSLEGPPVLLASTSEQAFDAHLWLCAWLLSSSGQPVEILEWPVTGSQLREAVRQLQPRALVMSLGRRIDMPELQRSLPLIDVPKILSGPALPVHQAGLSALQSPGLYLLDTPQATLHKLQQLRDAPATGDPL